MEKREHFEPKYNPPFYLHKINNYQKAVYERKGHWTEKEKVKYGVFLEIYRDKFQDRENPILNKMFRVMSDFIKTRNHNQCRSHHQKMQRERFEIDSILDSIRSKYHPREYELFFQKYSRHIQALNVESVLNEKGFTPHRNVQKRKKKQTIKYQEIQQKITYNKEVKLNNQYESIIKINKQEYSKEDQSQNEGNQREQENKLTAEKQLIGIQGTFVVKEDKQISQIVNKQQFIELKQGPLKPSKELKKTGLEYDSDSDNCDQKSQAVFVDIPMDINLHNQKSLMSGNMGVNMMMPQYPNGSNISQSHLPIHSFGTFNKFQSHFNQGFSMGTSQFGYEQNYASSMKQLDQKKKWHLSEAGRLCNQMNEHLQQANLCEQMKEAVMKQMMELRRQFYYPPQFASNQF